MTVKLQQQAMLGLVGRQILEKNGNRTKQIISYLQTARNLMIQLERKSCIRIMLIQFGIPVKLERLINMCLNETYSRLRMGKIYLTYFLLETV